MSVIVRRCPECKRLFGASQLPSHLWACLPPLVCVCRIPRPDRIGQCATCLRVVIWTWPPHRQAAALRAYPYLEDQRANCVPHIPEVAA